MKTPQPARCAWVPGPDMLGRFLEISIHTPVIQESLAFYEALGFTQASVNETWPYPYAVVTDGRLFIGLHGGFIRSPALTFVLPQLARGLDSLRQLGITIDEERVGNDVFNQATFTDPAGQCVNLLEARTFSPLDSSALDETLCGYFTEFGVPVRDTAACRAFWEPLGFVAMEEEPLPFPRTPLASDHLNLGLYRTRALRQPVLSFEAAAMASRLAQLRARGFELSDEMPDSLDDASNAILEAPEGTRLLLMQSDL
jgi:catechol 2,3-dioxygenase-like lactoylglutathione lyase family enzyme